MSSGAIATDASANGAAQSPPPQSNGNTAMTYASVISLHQLNIAVIAVLVLLVLLVLVLSIAKARSTGSTAAPSCVSRRKARRTFGRSGTAVCWSTTGRGTVFRGANKAARASGGVRGGEDRRLIPPLPPPLPRFPPFLPRPSSSSPLFSLFLCAPCPPCSPSLKPPAPAGVHRIA
ncbi:unnamed protein product [Closterium sp. NIES-64]|nr:unnamed protein product [Closterium sp. NIES-64]